MARKEKIRAGAMALGLLLSGAALGQGVVLSPNSTSQGIATNLVLPICPKDRALVTIPGTTTMFMCAKDLTSAYRCWVPNQCQSIDGSTNWTCECQP